MGSLSHLKGWDFAYASVGKFLCQWAVLESHLNDALAAALDIEGAPMAILRGNVQLRDKLHILRTAVTLYQSEVAAKPLVKVLHKIGNYSTTRNMMAHEAFLPTDAGDAVEFLVIKAKGKLEFPTVVWSSQEFEAAYNEIESLAQSIEAGIDQFKMPRLALTLARQPANVLASLGWPALDLPDSPNRLPQSDRGSHQSTNEEQPPEHPSPPEK